MKKILILLIVFLLIPCVGFADDGTIFDKQDMVTYNVQMDEYECELGGEIEYTISYKNNTSEVLYITGLDTSFSRINSGYSDSVSKLLPGKELSVKILENIPDFAEWYKTEDGYFMDVYFSPSGVNEETGYGKIQLGDEFYYWENHKPLTLKITNLYDGSDYINIEGVDDIGYIDYYQIMEHYTNYKGPLYNSGSVTQSATIENISNSPFELVSRDKYEYLETYTNANGSEFVYEVQAIKKTINPNEKINHDIEVEKFADLSKKSRNSEMVFFPVTFMIDGKHYGVFEQRVYKARYHPENFNLTFDVTKFDGDYSTIDENYAFFKIEITNKGQDIPDFKAYISDEQPADETLYEEDFEILGELEKGKSTSIYAYLEISKSIVGYFASGNTIANEWGYFKYSDNKPKYSDGDEVYSYTYIDRISSRKSIEDDLDAPSQDAAVDQDVEDKTQPDENSKVADNNKQEISSAASQGAILSVEEKSSMPVWVVIVLGVALLAAIIVIILLRKKQH